MATLGNKNTIREIILLLFIPSILKNLEVSVSQAETEMIKVIFMAVKPFHKLELQGTSAVRSENYIHLLQIDD
jgi:hypothetical protein